MATKRPTNTGASLITRLAVEHSHRPTREVLAELVASERTISGVARSLGESRSCVRAALDAFGLRDATPVGSEAHAEATRAGLAAKRERDLGEPPPASTRRKVAPKLRVVGRMR